MKNNYMIITLLGLFLFGHQALFSQAYSDSENNSLRRIYVAIDQFTGAAGIDQSAVDKAHGAVMNAVSGNKRMDLIDRSELDKLAAEREMQKSSDLSSTHKVADGDILGASYYITGHVSEYEAYPTDKKGRKDFKANFKVQVKFINVQTGEVLLSDLLVPRHTPTKALTGTKLQMYEDDPETFENLNVKLFTYANPTLAYQNIMSQLPRTAKEFIDQLLFVNFPIYYDVHEVHSSNLFGTPKDIGFLGGTKSYVEVGDVYRLMVVSKISLGGGQTTDRMEEIGRVKVISVGGENYSTAKITKGARRFSDEQGMGSKFKIAQ